MPCESSERKESKKSKKQQIVKNEIPTGAVALVPVPDPDIFKSVKC